MWLQFCLVPEIDEKNISFGQNLYINNTYMGWIQVNFVTFCHSDSPYAFFLYSPQWRDAFILCWLIFNDAVALEICHLLLFFCSSRILNNLLALVTPDKHVRLMKSINQPLAPPVFGGEESGSLIYIMQWKWTKSIALAKTEKEIRMINGTGRCAVFALMDPRGCVQM